MSNICPCPTPPGGQATCSDNQLAICRVIDGEAHTECHDLTRYYRPRGFFISRDLYPVLNTVIGIVTGRTVRREGALPIEDLTMLRQGRCDLPGGGKVLFRLPRFLQYLFN